MILAKILLILKRMAIITIGGNIGAGKTVLAGRLSKALGYEELYIGGIFRELAAQQGLSIEKFYEALRDNPALEREIDARQNKLMMEKSNLIVQGRIAWYFAKMSPFPSINIFLSVDPRIGAERKIKEGRYPNNSMEEVLLLDHTREDHERVHYKDLYGIEDHLNPNQYDIVIDTSRMTQMEVFENISKKLSLSKI